ncbi:unnamed protein product [Caenorhabditis sp. 36 PRJEB53466]|nr:unnamed protein product [Caenorhabditis sp. 36 PRJEB53466]
MFELNMSDTDSLNIFGVFRFYHKCSPYNCGAPPPFRYFFRAFTVLTIVAQLFRVYWMFWQCGSETFTFGWAESRLYGFIAFESFVITIALARMTSNDSLTRFERNLGALQTLRIHKSRHKKHDNYRILYIRLFIAGIFLFVSFLLTAVYLSSHKLVTFGAEKHSSWYWILDPIIAVLCGYSNLLYLPTHSLLHHALTREFDVFNEEIEEASKGKKLATLPTLRTFGERQVKLFEYANFMTGRMERLMTWAPLFALIALLMGTYIVSEFDKTPKTVYLICLISVTISCFIMSFTLLYPVAFVQEANLSELYNTRIPNFSPFQMTKTASILMNDAQIQQSDDPFVFQCYRIMLDRSMHNRTMNHVLHVFSVTRKNIEKAFFVHSLVIIVMVIVHDFQQGLQVGFGQLAKFVTLIPHAN